MGGILAKMGIKKSSRVRNNSTIEPNLPPPRRRPHNIHKITENRGNKNFSGATSILKKRNSINNANSSNQIGPVQQQPQKQTRSLMNKIRGREITTNKNKLNITKKRDIFTLLNKNTIFILQRHATSCANIINKGFETGSTSYSIFGKSRLVAEIAPDSMLSSIGIDECNQVHDYLTNVGTEIINLVGFEHLFCCSELFRTQQTMFLSYFELIDKYNIKIMILPWLNEERAVGGVNKDNLTISLNETKKRWKEFIEQQILKFPLLEKLEKLEKIIDTRSNTVFIPGNKINKEEKDKLITQVRLVYKITGDITIKEIQKKISEEKDKYSKFLDWNNVFSLPDFIYRTPTGPEATFDKRVDLEKLYKIKMEESKIGLTRTKQSYNADDLLFALPFILYLSKKATDSQKQLKIFMTGHSRTMVKLINLITLRSASNLDLRSMIKKGVNKVKGVKMITGDKSPYYSKPSLEKQQMMNAEIIQLEPVNLMRVFGGRDKFEKFENLTSNDINTFSNKSSNNVQEIIDNDFNLCRKFPVHFSEHVISKQLKDETFKEIKPFYFFYNSNLGIVYSLVDIVEQKIQTSNDKLYKEGYPLRVFFGMTLLQYIGYLMVAKAVVSKMKDEFKANPKYDYQGLLDKISELDKEIHIYVGDTGNINLKNNFKKLQVQNASQPQQKALQNPVLNASQPVLEATQNPAQSKPYSNKLKKLESLIETITRTGFNRQNHNLNTTYFRSKNENVSRSIKNIINDYLISINIDTINIDEIDNIISDMLRKANVHNTLINAEMKTYTKYWFYVKLYQKYNKGLEQTAGQNTSSVEIKYMEKNATEYFDKKAKQFPKYSITIKQYLFDTLPELKDINDRQEKRKKFVELLHTSLLSTCNIKKEQQNKITDFMKNSFPTGLLEQESKTPTRGFNEQGQGMLERVQKLNEKVGSYLLKDSGYLIVPFIPLSKDGQNQLDKIIEHMKKMGGFYLQKFEGRNYNIQTKILRANEIYNDLISRTGIYPLLKLIYPSINDSVGKYIVGMIYKILITYANYNFCYPQITKYLFFLLIIIYINYGIQYLLDFLKKAYIIFSVIENFTIPDIINRILRPNKKNYSILISRYIFFSDMLISTEIQFPYSDIPYNKGNLNQLKALIITRKKRNYSIEEKILHIKRYYYYVSYFYNEDVKKYYEKYGLIFLYFSLYIPDLIYYTSDNKDFNKNIKNILETEQHSINYAKKIQYLFKLSDNEIKNKSIAVIDEFLPKLIDYIKTLDSNNYDIISKSNINLNIDKLYNKIMGRLFKSNREQVHVNIEDYSTNNSTNTLKKEYFEKNYKKLIELITEPVHFESNEKAIATISGIPAKFEQSLVSSHYFAFEFNLDKIKEVCSKGLMKFSKKNCIQFVKADIENVMDTVNFLFNKSVQTGIWKFFIDIQVSLIKEGFVFASQEINTLIYISRIFGSSFDSILEIFYQSFPYMMFCFEYVTKIANDIFNMIIPPCNVLNKLFDRIGLEKMIILYKYLNITNIEIMEYIKKYGIIFLIYALLTPFHIFQTDLTGKNITLYTETIINKLNAMNNFELIKQVKSVFDDRKIVEFIQKVGANKNNIFGKVPVDQNNSNINLNINKFSNNGSHKHKLPNMVNTEPNGQNADFIFECFTVNFVPFVPFVPMTVRGNRNVLDEIIAFYKEKKVGVYKKDIISQVNRDYSRNYGYFNLICKNYLKINDDSKIRDLYNSFWKIIVDNYGNLNIEYSQRANIILWIPLFYKYNKLDFFKNIYLVNSLNIESFSASEFMKYELKATQAQSIDDNWEYYRYISFGCDIITNIFQQRDLKFYENNDNLNKIKIFLYYIIEYNNDDVQKYYKNNGLIFFYFTLILPNIMLYEYTKNDSEFKKYGASYNRSPDDEKLRDVNFIMKLVENEEDFKTKSNVIIEKYIKKFKKYINSLNTNLKLGNVSNNANKNKTITFVNDGKNNSVKAKYENNSESQQNSESTKVPVDIYTTLLTQGVYFDT